MSVQVSAKTEEDDIVQGLRCGADDYVPKPFKRAELAARIRAHIRARDAFQQQQVGHSIPGKGVGEGVLQAYAYRHTGM